MAQTLAPLEVDRVTISIIVDNNIDLLMESSDIAKRFPMDPKPFEKLFPLGEHGFSAVIKVEREDKPHTERLPPAARQQTHRDRR